MKKFFLIIFLTQFLTINCKADTFDFYKDSIGELLQDPRTRKFKGNEGDVDDLSGCPILFEVGKWEGDGRNWSWLDKTIINSTGVSMDLLKYRGYKNLNTLLQDKSQYPIYIGPWLPITLTHTTNFFPFTKTTTEQKQIRFFAYTGIGGGSIQYQYESQTSENKSIPEKKFSLPLKTKDGSKAIAPDRFSLCTVKWIAKFGYNAIADCKKNPWFPFFSKEYLKCSGNIIDSETKEIIAEGVIGSNSGGSASKEEEKQKSAPKND